jgi:DNA-binding transcriptional LysR family regulator
MDIYQLRYFVAIVESDFNLSLASRKHHISQPALTQAIKKFETEEKVELFTRASGRLSGLTNVGENFYNNALIVLENHDRMLRDLRENSTVVKGKVRIGIPPLILTVMFTDFLSNLIIKNPDIRFEIIEEGAFELRRQLILQEIDFAVLLQPTDLNPQVFKEEIILIDQLTCFMSTRHPLSNKESIQWTDLRQRKLAIFTHTFMIHHQLKRKFESLNISPDIALMSSSWDFLLESTRGSDFITILPSPVNKHFSYSDVKEIPFDPPFPWKVVLVYPIKSRYSRIENYVRQSMISYFIDKKSVESI